MTLANYIIRNISQKIKPHECEKLPLRWVVECILAWLGHSRRPSKDYEILSASENTMVKIRLRRMGAKKAPFYRIVVADSRYPRDGRFIEEIGTYNPLTQPAEIKVDAERAQAWIKTGAQPTETVKALLKKAGAI